MSVETELAQFASEKDMLLTIGVFDGVHLGHQYLISQLTERARQQGWLSGVVTFRQHPLEILSPPTRLSYLTGFAQKVSLLKGEGVDAIITLSFTPELARLSTRQFVALLQKYLKMRGLIIGPDFALGRHREGNADTLRRLGQEMNFTVTVVLPVKVNGEVVSSTAIREALAGGDMARVVRLTGHPFYLEGPVMRGTGRGAQLGFPTANLAVDPEQALPADGIYATWAYLDGKVYPSVTNIGRRPTFDGKERTIETYILNYSAQLYGRELRIDIVARLRAEERFATIEALKKQILDDVARARVVLDSRA